MNPNVRPASPEDVVKVGMNLKADDAAELAALNIEANPTNLRLAHMMSHKVYAWGPEDDPMAVFGVTPDWAEGVGYIWSLSTPDILKHWREVHPFGQRCVGLLAGDPLACRELLEVP